MKNSLMSKIIIFISALVIVFCMFMIYKIINKNTNNTNNTVIKIDNIKKENENSDIPKSDVLLSLISYELYEINELDVRFIIANINFSSDKAINFNLEDLVYSNNKSAKDNLKFVENLEKNYYFLANKNVVFNINSDNNHYKANVLFILNKDDKSFNVTYKDQKITFDLNKDKADARFLKRDLSEDKILSDKQNYELIVSKSYDLGQGFLTKDGLEYNLSSQLKLKVFLVEVKALANFDIKVEEAWIEINGLKYHALDETYMSEKFTNIISRNIKQQENGALFFELEKDHKEGKVDLFIKLGGLDEPIKTQVNF